MLLTPEQREKLLKQRQDYESAAENLEDQLLKLKVIINNHRDRTTGYLSFSLNYN